MERFFVRAASEAACNWCGPSALADSDPGAEALCTRHQAAYYERRAQDAAVEDEAWWNEHVRRMTLSATVVAVLS